MTTRDVHRFLPLGYINFIVLWSHPFSVAGVDDNIDVVNGNCAWN